jgi:acyl-CoA thioester hydrolase
MLDFEPKLFHWPVRIYWEDTDAGGVVYHASYLRFFERARTEWLRGQGIAQDALRAAQNVLFVLNRIEVRYVKPARLDDLLDVQSRLVELKRASFVVDHAIYREGDGALIATGQAAAVCLAEASFRPTPIPKDIHQLLRA